MNANEFINEKATDIADTLRIRAPPLEEAFQTAYAFSRSFDSFEAGMETIEWYIEFMVRHPQLVDDPAMHWKKFPSLKSFEYAMAIIVGIIRISSQVARPSSLARGD